MKNSTLLVALLLLLAWWAPSPAAQAPPAQPPTQKPTHPPTQPPAQPAAPKPAASRPAQSARGSVTFFITNPQGRGVNEATVSMTGPATREGETNRDGVVTLAGVRSGNYRVRVEAEDYITLERDISARSGLEVEMTLNPAPERPTPTPAAPKPEQPAPTPAGPKPDPSAPVEALSLPDWIERNLIGRNDPVRESPIRQTGGGTATVLQVRDPVKQRSHDGADEFIYVIAGEGALTANGRETRLDAGVLAVVPRGVTFSLERRGRNPLIVLSVLAGTK